MDDQAIERILAACEAELDAGHKADLRALGFWRAVAAVKRRTERVDRFADRIAAIDREAFQQRVRLIAPIQVGVMLVFGGLFVDAWFLGAAAASEAPLREILVLVGGIGMLVATHGIAHFIVGTLVRIRFTDWFLDVPRRPQPGFKIDYATYLRASPRERALMHASGAIVSKIVPFAVAGYAHFIGADRWVVIVMLGIGVVSLFTDAIFSVRSSDWKRFRREMRYARSA